MPELNSERDERPTGRRSRAAVSGLEQRLRRRLAADRIDFGTPVIVGFSGGPDSLCLAAALGSVGRGGRLAVSLLHVDHGLRPESAREAARAVEMADALGLPISVSTLKPEFMARHPGVGLEEALRRGRYLALARAVGKAPGSIVALAHHQQDQAETVLLHLLRGAGTTGAAGMSARSELPVPWWPAAEEVRVPARLWRPLLAESKVAIEAYVAELGIAPTIDPSNADRSFRRNQIRWEALPLLESLDPGAVGALARYGEIAGDDDAAISAIAESRLSLLRHPNGGVDAAGLGQDAVSIQRRVRRRWLAQRVDAEVPFERIEAIRRQLASGTEGWFIEVDGDRGVAVVSGTLWHGRLAAVREQARRVFGGPTWGTPNRSPRVIGLGQSTVIGGWRIGTAAARQGLAADRRAGSARLPHWNGDSQFELRPVRRSDRLWMTRESAGDVLRRHRVSPWIRDDVVGVWGEPGLLVLLGLPAPTVSDESDDRAVNVWWCRVDEGQGDVEPSER